MFGIDSKKLRLGLEPKSKSPVDNDSHNATAHSANTDDMEFIPLTVNPINYFSNQIISIEGNKEGNNLEEIFPRIYRHSTN